MEIKSYYTEIDGRVSEQFIILNADDNLVGSCLLHIDEFSGFFQDFFISKSIRGKGWGSKLISTIKNFAKNRGLYSINCNVNKNNKAAFAFYLANSFFVSGEEWDDYKMTLKIPGR